MMLRVHKAHLLCITTWMRFPYPNYSNERKKKNNTITRVFTKSKHLSNSHKKVLNSSTPRVGLKDFKQKQTAHFFFPFARVGLKHIATFSPFSLSFSLFLIFLFCLFFFWAIFCLSFSYLFIPDHSIIFFSLFSYRGFLKSCKANRMQIRS